MITTMSTTNDKILKNKSKYDLLQVDYLEKLIIFLGNFIYYSKRVWMIIFRDSTNLKSFFKWKFKK